MKYVLIAILFLNISFGFSQDIDTLIISTKDTLLGQIDTIRNRHGGPKYLYHKMNPQAPDAYYKLYKPHFDDSTKSYLLREGLFFKGYEEGEWIEYYPNGKVYKIEKWNRKGDTGYKKFFTKKGKLQEYIKWEEGEIVEKVCYKKCK